MELAVEGLAHGGDGVAHLDGLTLFVPGGVPGDRLRVELQPRSAKQRHGRARIVEVLSPSPQRVAPSCAHRPRCGGCPWHEIDPGLRAAAKARNAVETLRRVGGIEVDQLPALLDEAEAPAAAEDLPGLWRGPREQGYRIRARLAISRRGQTSQAGLRAGRSRTLVDVERCELLVPELLGPVATTLARARAEAWPDAELHVAAGAQPVACSAALVLRRPSRSAPMLAQQLLEAGFSAAEVLLQSGSGTPETLLQLGEPELWGIVAPDCPGGPFAHDALCFSQPQLDGNRALIRAVLSAAAAQPDQRILELHAGAGNLSLPLAAAGARLRAVELWPRALRQLTANVRRAGLEQAIDVVEGDADAMLRDDPSALQRCDTLVLDPPRSGCVALAGAIEQLDPRRIVYVSCDPATLARDTRQLMERGYRVTALSLLDLMPGSWHIETVLQLQR